MHKRLWMVFVLLLMVSLTAGCSKESKKEVEEKQQDVSITVTDYKFTPGTINTEVGTLLEFKLKNSAQQKHEMVIDTPEGQYELEVDAGKEVNFGIKFRLPGTYAIMCELPGHLDQGMKGEIVVKGKGTVAKFAKGEGGGGEEKMQDIKMTLSDFKFDPGTVTTGVDTLLEFGVKNSATQKHEMVIDGKSAEFEVEVEPGQDLGFAVKYRKKGTYEYKCEIPGHLEQGMKGSIVVE